MTSWQACLYSSKMFMDLTHVCEWNAACDQKINHLDNLQQPAISSQPEALHNSRVSSSGAVSASANLRPSKEEIDQLYIKLNNIKSK